MNSLLNGHACGRRKHDLATFPTAATLSALTAMPAVFVYAGNGPWWLGPLLFLAPLVVQLEPSLLLGPFAAFAWVLREVLQPVSV